MDRLFVVNDRRFSRSALAESSEGEGGTRPKTKTDNENETIRKRVFAW